MNTPRPFEDFLHALDEDRLTTDELARLNELLADDPQRRRQLVAHARLRSDLHRLLAGEAAPAARRAPTGRIRWASIAAAALLLGIGLVWWPEQSAVEPGWHIVSDGDRAVGDRLQVPAGSTTSLTGPAGLALRLLGPATITGLQTRPLAPALANGHAWITSTGELGTAGFQLRSRHGSAAISGTRFGMLVEETDCLIGVAEGSVAILDRQGIERGRLPAGRAAVLRSDGSLIPAPLLADWTAGSRAFNFGPPQAQVPGFANDHGQPFDPARGHGWLTERPRRTRDRDADRLGHGSLLVAGSKDWTDHWECRLPAGRYAIAVVCGDRHNAQGPHFVAIEGRVLIDGVVTAADEFHRAEATVDLDDGRLSMIVGIAASEHDPAGDMHATDTALCFLTARRLE